MWGPEVATDASRSRSYTGGGFVCRDTALIYDFMARTVRARRVNLLFGITTDSTLSTFFSPAATAGLGCGREKSPGDDGGYRQLHFDNAVEEDA